jgi:hypothetical protein
MKLKFLGLSFLLLGIAAIVIAQVTISWSDVRYKYDFVQVEKYRIGMETLIGFTSEKGKEITTLTTIKDDFLTQAEKLKTAYNTPEIDAIKTKMKEDVSNFKAEAIKQLTGYGKEAKSKLDSASVENKTYLDDLLDNARNLHKDRNTQLVDYSVTRGENAIQKLKDAGYDATTSEAKLTEIRGKRANFIGSMNDLISACRGVSQNLLGCPVPTAATAVLQCDLKVSAYCSLRDEIKSDFGELQDLVYQSAGITR